MSACFLFTKGNSMSTEKNINYLIPPKKKLTVKQRRFIYHYIHTDGNGVESARLAGYKGKYETLSSVSIENLQKPIIQDAIKAIFEKNGLTETNLLMRHIQLLNAEREFVIGEEKCTTPDNNVRLGALKLAYEITGRLIKKVEHSGEIKLTEKERDAHLNRIKHLLSD